MTARWRPWPTQLAFLLAPELEILFGGAAGGAKSVAILMAAAQYVHVPGYHALLLRRTFADLNKPGALIPMSKEWWFGGGRGATWDGSNHRWTFPSGATVSFGYCETENDIYQYQGANYHFIGVDELTQWKEFEYRYLFSRLRREAESRIPIRMRATSNPGGVGHEWVRNYFLLSQEKDRRFLASKLDDNPGLDRAEYRKSLARLDPVTRERLLNGDWEIRESGGVFKREWIKFGSCAHPTSPRIRYWDMAATEGGGCYTVGTLMARDVDGTFVVEHAVRGQWSPGRRDAVIRSTAKADAAANPGGIVAVGWEEEPGSAGKSVTEATTRALAGYRLFPYRPTGPKPVRWGPLASQFEAGNVRLVEGAWCLPWLDDLVAAQDDDAAPKDVADSAAGAFLYLSTAPSGDYAIGSPREENAPRYATEVTEAFGGMTPASPW